MLGSGKDPESRKSFAKFASVVAYVPRVSI